MAENSNTEIINDKNQRRVSRVTISDNVEFIITTDHYNESNYRTFSNATDNSNNPQGKVSNIDLSDTHSSLPTSELTNSSNDIGNSFNFHDGSFLTRSIIEPELETYFQTASSWQSGILIMANVCLGMGILNFPRIVYETGGIIQTMCALGIFVCLIMGSLYITAYCCRYYGCVNYQDMVRIHCGRHLGIVCSVLLFLEVFGSLIVKMVVLQDQLDRFYSVISHGEIEKHLYLMPVFAIAFFLPMCFIRDFSLFKYVSVGGVLAAIYVTMGVAVAGYFISGPADPAFFKESISQPRDINLLFPLLVYGFHGHIEAPLVFAGLKKQRLNHFMNTVYCYCGIATFCYALTAIFGYLTFARNTNADFLLNYSSDNWYANCASIIVCFKLFTSFPVLFFVVRSVFSSFYTIIIRKIPKSNLKMFLEHYSTARLIQTLIIFFLVILMAVVIPNISNAISIIGAISCHFSFTFPGLCFLLLYRKSTFDNKKHFFRMLFGAFYVVLGMFLFGTNLTVTIQTLMKGKTVA